MDDDAASTSARADRAVKPEGDDHDDTRVTDHKPTYKSWKKKYRKMRIIFDQKMHDSEELHKQEQKALAMAKRVALENDRILDLLFDLNQSQQIPLDKRIDLAMTPPAEAGYPPLDADTPSEGRPKPSRQLEDLLKETPHTNFTQAKEHLPALIADLEPFEGEQHPPHFLTADDIDDYLYEMDKRIDEEHMLPTLAPSARPSTAAPAAPSSHSIAMRNPTSVYNWLRKHAPKTFLQDGEDKDKDDAHEEAPADARRKRRSVGVTKERGSGRGRGGKRKSAVDRASVQIANDTFDASMDDDHDYSVSTPAPSARAAAAKRKRDDDAGYRPKGGSSTRPTKKKRKSIGGDGEITTPTSTRGGSRRGRGRLSEGPRSKAERADD
ncbi:IEC3 subunit of the Ino80 complex, chromatin re-modelling-domain-containing protein [Plectosphaerella plurivora]|uniref:IEC3 subunit of the Ino80 complex, chromatin re-modelling-domain-containing protein n=1 Tax=Plectosphaerella plurivora TaxID=936078 RepID=A0A9P8VFK3_9PEZI|nr:IEC3 subunit of the Ino80 complex, chromatin re-modelling-domain-containing protein [Plectosphaerella plurivora]